MYKRQGVNKNLFNADESTMQFLQDVLTQVATLFPGKFVHIGGDEAVKDQWKASPKMQARIRKLGVKNEAGLQAWMVARLEKALTAHGKRLIGWDEILEGKLPASATVMSWRGTEGGIDAAKKGHDVVMTPSDTLYLDYLQTTDVYKRQIQSDAERWLAAAFGFEQGWQQPKQDLVCTG